LLFFPGGYGLQNFNRYRKIRHFFPLDMDVKYFTNFVVRLERLIETGHLTRFFSFLLRCSHRAEEVENRYILRDLQTIQLSVIHKESLSSELLHQFLIWSPEASSLYHIVQYAVASGITSGFSSDQMYRIHRNVPNLPQIVDFCYSSIP
jgi:hypothetical protein